MKPSYAAECVFCGAVGDAVSRPELVDETCFACGALGVVVVERDAGDAGAAVSWDVFGEAVEERVRQERQEWRRAVGDA